MMIDIMRPKSQPHFYISFIIIERKCINFYSYIMFIVKSCAFEMTK